MEILCVSEKDYLLQNIGMLSFIAILDNLTHSIHAWYIYLHLPLKNQLNVGKYTSPMDPMGNNKELITLPKFIANKKKQNDQRFCSGNKTASFS